MQISALKRRLAMCSEQPQTAYRLSRDPHWHNTALVSRQMMNVGCGMAGVTGGQREVMGKAVL